MAKKTVLKKVLKYAPMKTDFMTGDEHIMQADIKEIGHIDVFTDDEEYNEIDDTVTVDENGEVRSAE